MKKLLCILLSVCMSLSLFGCSSETGGSAENYPNKPIEIVVPYAAGGQSDIVARLMSDKLSKNLNGQPIIVVNKPGAGAMTGTIYVAESDPDGYTIGLVTSNVPTLIWRTQKIDFDMKSLIPINSVVDNTQILAVRQDSPWKTAEELMEYLKNSKEKTFTCGLVSIGSSQHLILEMISQYTGCEITPVPFPSAGDALSAMYQNTIDSVIMWPTNYDETQTRLLITSGSERNGIFPDIPTLKELGLNFSADFANINFVVPAGVSEDKIKILDEAIKKTLEDPEVIKTFENVPLALKYRDRDETLKLWDEQVELVVPFLQELKLLD